MSEISSPPVYAVLPFVAMLLAIAVLPLWIPHWWERNRNKLLLSAGLGLPVLALYLFRRPSALLHMRGLRATMFLNVKRSWFRRRVSRRAVRSS